VGDKRTTTAQRVADRGAPATAKPVPVGDVRQDEAQPRIVGEGADQDTGGILDVARVEWDRFGDGRYGSPPGSDSRATSSMGCGGHHIRSGQSIMKPIPMTPKLGTTFPEFPLDSVRSRFQIMRLFPGYRNYFSKAAWNRRA